jgi:hypothetical protein
VSARGLSLPRVQGRVREAGDANVPRFSAKTNVWGLFAQIHVGRRTIGTDCSVSSSAAPPGIPGWSGLSADWTLLLALDSLGARGRSLSGVVRGLTVTRYDLPVFRLAMVNWCPDWSGEFFHPSRLSECCQPTMGLRSVAGVPVNVASMPRPWPSRDARRSCAELRSSRFRELEGLAEEVGRRSHAQ